MCIHTFLLHKVKEEQAVRLKISVTSIVTQCHTESDWHRAALVSICLGRFISMLSNYLNWNTAVLMPYCTKKKNIY